MGEMDDDDDCPMRRSGRSFAGWRLERNRHQVGDLLGTLFRSSGEAKQASEKLIDYPVTWVERATDPEGNAYYQGGHPEMMEHENRYKSSWLSDERRKQEQKESDELRARLGHTVWWDRWYVEPDYSPIYVPVEGAVRPLSHSRFYAAPYLSSSWAVWQDGGTQPLEVLFARDEAVQAATRLGLGLNTARMTRKNRYTWLALGAFLTYFVVVVLL